MIKIVTVSGCGGVVIFAIAIRVEITYLYCVEGSKAIVVGVCIGSEMCPDTAIVIVAVGAVIDAV